MANSRNDLFQDFKRCLSFALLEFYGEDGWEWRFSLLFLIPNILCTDAVLP